MAYDVANNGLSIWAGDLRLRQLQALALARSGACAKANAALTSLYEEDHTDEETLGMLARTHKDLGMRSKSEEERCEHLAKAYALYADAYEKEGSYWTGINAATVAFLRGDKESSRKLAEQEVHPEIEGYQSDVIQGKRACVNKRNLPSVRRGRKRRRRSLAISIISGTIHVK